MTCQLWCCPSPSRVLWPGSLSGSLQPAVPSWNCSSPKQYFWNKTEYFFLLQTHHRFFSHPYTNYLLSPQRLQYVSTVLCWPAWTKIYIKYLKILRIIIFGSILLGIMFNFKYILSQQTNFLLKFQALKIKYFVTWTVKLSVRSNFYLLSSCSQLLQIVNLLLLQ